MWCQVPSGDFAVPEQIKSKINFNSFKGNVKTFLLEQSIYFGR
jgi:hypothetical protein